MIQRRPIIGVMGSSEAAWLELADPLGHMIARFGYHLLTGAGGGAMTAVAKAFVETPNREGVSIGVVPVKDNYTGGNVSLEEYPNPFMEIPVVTPLSHKDMMDKTPYSRNRVNIMTPNAIVVLPGAHGTQTETSLAMIYNKPLFLFGPEDAFKGFPSEAVGSEDVTALEEFLTYVSTEFRKDEG